MKRAPGLRFLSIAASLCLLTAAYTQHGEQSHRGDGYSIPSALQKAAILGDGACGVFGEVTLLSGTSAQTLADIFRAVQYDLQAVRAGTRQVPPLLLADLPDDMGSVQTIADRKELFLGAILPAVVFVDERILAERQFVESVRARLARGIKLRQGDEARLKGLSECYGLSAVDLDEMLRRIDVVPPALALAQAAIESGWGTSRFVQDGNALLGQRTVTAEGLSPAGLANADFRVQSFSHLVESVAAFARNLNTHDAYSDFRLSREKMRRSGAAFDSAALAGTLLRYSELRERYVTELRAIIRGNRLEPLDLLVAEPGERAEARAWTAARR